MFVGDDWLKIITTSRSPMIQGGGWPGCGCRKGWKGCHGCMR
jgi:hypothetical protein